MEPNNVGTEAPPNDISFKWWKTWAVLGLTIGNLYCLGAFSNVMGFAVALVVINSIMCILILNMNKYAFLVATILSLNPLVWIINGIYLKNRWDHPLVNSKLVANSQ